MPYENLEYSKMPYDNWEYSKMSYDNLEYSKMSYDNLEFQDVLKQLGILKNCPWDITCFSSGVI